MANNQVNEVPINECATVAAVEAFAASDMMEQEFLVEIHGTTIGRALNSDVCEVKVPLSRKQFSNFLPLVRSTWTCHDVFYILLDNCITRHWNKSTYGIWRDVEIVRQACI